MRSIHASMVGPHMLAFPSPGEPLLAIAVYSRSSQPFRGRQYHNAHFDEPLRQFGYFFFGLTVNKIAIFGCRSAVILSYAERSSLSSPSDSPAGSRDM